MQKWTGLVLLLTSPLFGQPAATVTAVRAGRMIDVQSGTVVRNAVVLVVKDRIQAAGQGIPIPAGARLIDLGEVTLLPGLIDSHTHLLQYYETAWRSDPAKVAKIRQMTTVNKVL